MRYLLGLGVVLSGCAQAASPETASLAPTPLVAASAEPRMTAETNPPECSTKLVERPLGSLAVVLADGEDRGAAVIVQLSPDKVVGRVELGYQPVIAVDPLNRQLLAICTIRGATDLISYGLDDLRVLWRVSLPDRIYTKGPAAPRSVLASADGRYVFTYHYRTLLPGDANAPGHTRNWIGVRDARTGALLREVDTPQCGIGSLFSSTADVLYLGCGLGGHLRAIRTDLWTEQSYYVTYGDVRLSGVTERGDRYIAVTSDLYVLVWDTATAGRVATTRWSDSAKPTAPYFVGLLAMKPDGSELWVPTSRDPFTNVDSAISHIDLAAGTRTDTRVAEARAVGYVHGRVLYVDGGRLAALGSSRWIDLGVQHRVIGWTILGGP